MRFSTSVLAGALVAVATAQSSTTVDTPTSTWSLTPEQSSVLTCYAACDQADVACLAKCNPVPNPSDDQVNKTNECVAKCDQGKGTESDILAYTQCQSKCIADNYYDDKSGTPNSAGSSATTTGSGSSQTSGSSASGTQSGSASGTGTSTASAASGTETGAASSLFGSSVALLGAVAAALAL